MTPSVCAVIVTYHPSAGVVEHIAKILTQVQGLVVVDNGSSADEIGLLRSRAMTSVFTLSKMQKTLVSPRH